METYDLIVVGAGPAGLFAAARTGAGGGTVLLLEKKKKPGRKLLVSGSGQCNITHAGSVTEFFTRYGKHGQFLKPALRAFTNTDLIAHVTERGVPLTTEEGGKVFPTSRKAQDVLDLLLAECREAGVTVRCGEPVVAVEKSENSFSVRTETGEYRSALLLIATGGASYPATGSTGDGYTFAASLGHTIAGTAPALTPVTVRDYPFADLAGISLQGVTVSLFRDGKKIGDQRGDLLFTHEGLSGPAILDLSRFIEQGDRLVVPVLPEGMREEITAALGGGGGARVRSVLSRYPVPERLLKRLIDLSEIPPETTCAHLTKAARTRLLQHLTACTLTVDALGGYGVAMVTRGGVALDEVNQKTMGSKRVEGLYFAGEVLDIDGDCGGFNIQAAFSTAALAAEAILGRAREKDRV
ncbi:MAG: NAD(P)/FAD-dependent oxidoreductase [Methanofollis sp.]|uniref:NAD(P)/FAD-dependent oxidoreductase n=1 Tax=Methanofollis sp. TaxID=2052835 RepID=UPI002607EE76|nr:NAD(P)/FAD-dependent oxidoreductase [Methanofollis sp.]MDD4255891.1 NAD(P)/FAD-dependent oxidoreductase [Methanofollis sp.]